MPRIAKTAAAPAAGGSDASTKLQTAQALLSELQVATSQGDIFEPDWLLKMDKLKSGNVAGYTDYCHVYAHTLQLTRQVEGTSTGSTNPSSSIQSTPMLVVVPSSGLKAGVGG